MLSLAIFPNDSFKWCSDKCIFAWLDSHKVTIDGEEITELLSKDGKKKIFKKDFLVEQ